MTRRQHTVGASRRLGRTATAGVLVSLLVGHLATASVWESSGEGRRAVIEVYGLGCPFCDYGLEKYLRKLDGAETVRIELSTSEAVVDFAEDSAVSDEEIRAAVTDAGFAVGEITWETSDSSDDSGGAKDDSRR